MTPDDPRHGTLAGHAAGCRCTPCGTAKLRYDKQRELDHLQGKPRRAPIVGVVRRIRALQALGYPTTTIAAQCPTTTSKALQDICTRSGQKYVYARLATEVAAAYDALSMTVPAGAYSTRLRTEARAKGWPPPLAWDEGQIDDPHATPSDWRYVPTDRTDLIRDLIALGADAHEACRLTGLEWKSLERWCQRKGHNDLWRELVARTRTTTTEQEAA